MLRRYFKLLVALSAVLLVGIATAAMAEDEAAGPSFITPFPAGDVYKLDVIGDDLADGLLEGVTTAFQGDQRLAITARPFVMNGLMRPDFDEKLAELEEGLKKEPIHIAVVMLGAWDRVSVKDAGGKRLQVGSDGWKTEYGARGDRLMKAFKRHNVAVYWVGLPVVRRSDANEDVQMMNDVMRERAYLNGLRFIDAYAGFIDENGGYSAYGPDVTGKIRLLRDGDGVYFTMDGYRKLAHFVERELRRDLNQAKADRSVPLLGDEADQAKINPDKAKLATAAPSGTAKPVAQALAAEVAAAGAQGAGEQKADNGRISLRLDGAGGKEEVVAVDIVRPAIPASVVALVTRRESADRLSQMGESVIDQIAGGFTVMSTVALATAPAANPQDRARIAPSQTPYFRVLFKGERLAPKPGRADDVSWPRPPGPSEETLLRSANPVETGSTGSPPVAPKAASEKKR